MLGAIAGDVIGSVHEYSGTKTKTFPLFVRHSSFTDDSVLTVAVAEWILTGNDLIDTFHEYVRFYPGRGYGGMFSRWAATRSREVMALLDERIVSVVERFRRQFACE